MEPYETVPKTWYQENFARQKICEFSFYVGSNTVLFFKLNRLREMKIIIL